MSKITESARDRECTVRLPCCNWRTDTTVFAHQNGAGMGRKMTVAGVDIGCYACSMCHDEIDRRTRVYELDFVKRKEAEAIVETFKILIAEGFLNAKT